MHTACFSHTGLLLVAPKASPEFMYSKTVCVNPGNAVHLHNTTQN